MRLASASSSFLASFSRLFLSILLALAALAGGADSKVWAQSSADDDTAEETEQTDPTEDVDTSGPADTDAPAAVSYDLDARLVQLDEALVRVQTPTRRYFASWVVLQAGLTASQAYVAMTWDSSVVRGSYLIGTALSSASLGLFLLQPKPALRGVKRYRAQPDGTPEEKQKKLEFGESILARQAKVDARTTGVTQHVVGVVAALGSGLGVLLGWDHSLKQAITRTVGVFFVAELQILTRPRISVQTMNDYANSDPSLQVGLLPMLDRDAQGLMLAGTF